MFKGIRSQSGFSLIELMVVVAIIGILASIGIPQMSKFQARARQSEAKAHLATIYTAEQSFQSEWSGYTISMKNIGAGATGTNLRYDGGFLAASVCAGGVPAGAPAEAAGTDYKMSQNLPAGTTYYNNGAAVSATTSTVGVAAVACANNVTPPTFTVAVWGQPNNAAVAAGTMDTWTVNQNKFISNTNNGIQ